MERPLVKNRLKELEVQEKKWEKRVTAETYTPAWITAMKNKAAKFAPEEVKAALEKSVGLGLGYFFGPGLSMLGKMVDSAVSSDAALINRKALSRAPTRENLRLIQKTAQTTRYVALGASAAEGTILGALGVGLPDIPVFLGGVLGSCFAVAKSFGFDYREKWEQALMLMMIRASFTQGQQYPSINAQVDRGIFALAAGKAFTYDYDQCLAESSEALAMALVGLKVVQGIPVVGVVGGLGNYRYASRLTGYVVIKCEKRFLLEELYHQKQYLPPY